MRLPNAHLARVDRAKVCEYLLNLTHPRGETKARFFSQFGFTADSWEILGSALLEHGQAHDVASQGETEFGKRYEIDGPLRAPDGRCPNIRTVWNIDPLEIAPRLITAYPVWRST